MYILNTGRKYLSYLRSKGFFSVHRNYNNVINISLVRLILFSHKHPILSNS
jgi:hypothetical protein